MGKEDSSISRAVLLSRALLFRALLRLPELLVGDRACDEKTPGLRGLGREVAAEGTCTREDDFFGFFFVGLER